MLLDRRGMPGLAQKVPCRARGAAARDRSAGTRSDAGRDCRDAFLGLSKTCNKLNIAFWQYLGSRLAFSNLPNVPRLPDLVRQCCAAIG
jgi:hypothetical protein